MRTHSKEFRDALTPETAYEVLVEGNKRFVGNLKLNRNLLDSVEETAAGQFPFAAVLSCMDSRTTVELIFDQGLGDIFSLRVAGNVVNNDILGSLEYACKVAGSKLIVVLGHSRCGAIKGAVDHVEMGHLSALLDKVGPALDKTSAARNEVSTETYVELVQHANVLNSMDEILRGSEILNALYKEGQIGLVGASYSVENGNVTFIKKMFAKEALVSEMAVAG
ncbi:MAG: carbonic anhydrase [Chitinophagaceae bacterium]|nr:MAG: carbonic anhydrase [Chitinophagaceae bacterium]